jgi:nitroreductase
MDVIEQIHAHRSVRAFEQREVPSAILDQVFAAVCRAPTGGGMQLYTLIVTTDGSRREQLSGVHFGLEMIRHAPVTLTFCVDTRRLSRWLELSGERPGFDNAWGFAMGFSDALVAAQNASLAAQSLGLGTCFVGSTFIAGPALCQFLECPSHVLPIATLIMGYPAESAARPTSRLPVEAVIHREKYQDHPDDELRGSYAQHARATFETFAAMPKNAAAVQAFAIDDLQGLYARLCYPADLLEMAANNFASAMAMQGFSEERKLARAEAVRAATSREAVAKLPLVRRLVLGLALATGELDGALDLAPEVLEDELFTFVSSRDSSLYDDFSAYSIFHPGLQTRLRQALTYFGAQVERAAE